MEVLVPITFTGTLGVTPHCVSPRVLSRSAHSVRCQRRRGEQRLGRVPAPHPAGQETTCTRRSPGALTGTCLGGSHASVLTDTKGYKQELFPALDPSFLISPGTVFCVSPRNVLCAYTRTQSQ